MYGGYRIVPRGLSAGLGLWGGIRPSVLRQTAVSICQQALAARAPNTSVVSLDYVRLQCHSRRQTVATAATALSTVVAAVCCVQVRATIPIRPLDTLLDDEVQVRPD